MPRQGRFTRHKNNLLYEEGHPMQHNMTHTSDQEKIIIEKIRTLSPDKVAEVVDFVDFISHRERDRLLLKAGNKVAEEAFKKVWDNTEDEIYDRF
jgi:hypothetical protein